MRVLKRNPWLSGLGVLLAAVVGYAGSAQAQTAGVTSTDQAGSIVIFPKVITDGTRDTLIEITNTSNMPAQAHCIYVNAIGHCSATTTLQCDVDTDCPSGPPAETCVHQCTETDFDIFLTAQQPTVWLASTGRQGSNDLGASFTGFNPGIAQGSTAVPLPLGTDFRGELKCIQTDPMSGDPFGGNSLIGTARLFDHAATSGASDYNAITFQAGTVNTSQDLNLDGTEYSACPSSLVLNHFADDATVSLPTGGTATVETELTLVPCTEDLLDLPQTGGTPVNATAFARDEFEGLVASIPIQFSCWLNRRLTAINPAFNVDSSVGGAFDSTVGQTVIVPASGKVCYTGTREGLTCTTDDNDPTTGCPNHQILSDGTSLGCRPWTQLIGVAEEFYEGGGSEAFNLDLGTPNPGDIIVLP